MIYTCAIVEDEPLAEKMLRKYIGRISFLELSWTCAYAQEAVELMQKKKADILFLDLQDAPVKTNSPFWHLVNQYDHVIVTSAYPAEVLNVQLPVMAFLHKPISFAHFLSAIEHFLVSPGN